MASVHFILPARRSSNGSSSEDMNKKPSVQFNVPPTQRQSSNMSDDVRKSIREDSLFGPYLSRRPSQAAQLVDCFQELNERLSAFERLAQLKQMVMDGKLKQDVFEEMYRINTEKLLEGKKGRRKAIKKFEVSSISVLDDFCVRHRSTAQGSPTFWDLTAAFNAKLKRGCLYFDRIVLRSAATFGQHSETIVIGSQPMTLVMYDDAPERVDLAFEKSQEQFVFDSELEKLMFVEALEKALETVARSTISKDEPVILGRPHRSHSQISKDFDARKSACLNLERMSSSNPSSGFSARSIMSTNSTTFSSMADDDEEEDVQPYADTEEKETEEKEEEENIRPEYLPEQNKKSFKGSAIKLIATETKEKQEEQPPLIPEAFNVDPTEPVLVGEEIATSVFIEVNEQPNNATSTSNLERARLAMELNDARKEREEALAVLEQKKQIALATGQADKAAQESLNALKVEEDNAIKLAVAARDEDMQAAKALADCVANEIAALNALDPEDLMSIGTTATAAKSEEEHYPMSNDLRTLIGKKPNPEPINQHHKLQYALQQARKALVAARQKVEKTSEKRRLAEAARREARRVVSAQMTKCSLSGKEVAHCEGAVLKAKAALSIVDDRIAHYEQCLLILVRHHERESPAMVVAKPVKQDNNNGSDWDQLIT